MTKTQHEIDCGTLIGALDLARERVTGDSIAAKQEQRDKLKIAISAMYHYRDTGQDKPSSAELRELLGDPDDRLTRDALQCWD